MENNMTKKKYKSYTAVDKMKILKECENTTMAKISRNYGISTQTIRNWKKNKLQLEELTRNKNSSKIKRVRRLTSEVFDKALHIWFPELRMRSIPISGPIIKAKALEMSKELDFQENFVASTGWLNKWKARHGIRQLYVCGEKKDAIYWISEAWNEVTASTIFKCWRNILPQEFFESNDQSLVQEVNNEEFISFFHQINNYENITQDDVQEWILQTDDIFPELPSNKEIIERVIADNTEDSENKDSEVELEVISTARAISSINTLLLFLEKNSLLITKEDLSTLIKIKDKITKMNITHTQTPHAFNQQLAPMPQTLSHGYMQPNQSNQGPISQGPMRGYTPTPQSQMGVAQNQPNYPTNP